MRNKQTPVNWLKETIKEMIYNGADFGENTDLPALFKHIEKAELMEEQMLCELVSDLKDYTAEGHVILGHDDREPIEFVEIFLENYTEGQIKIKGSLDSEVKVVSKPEMVRLRREANKKKNDKD